MVCRPVVHWAFGLLRRVRSFLFLLDQVLLYFSRRRRYRLHPRPSLVARISAPGVSILRPLKGLDTNLYENLESTFTQEYPNFEMIFSVADKDDQALPIVRDLMLKYPNINARMIIGK